MYYYYDSDTSKQVMPQIVRENCYKKGGYHRAPVVYQFKCTYLASINFVWFLFLMEYILYMCLMVSSMITMSRVYNYVV